MYIKSLELINFKCFKNDTINFSRNINILTGANNSGKSAIINALYKLRERIVIKNEEIRKTTTYAKLYINIFDTKEIYPFKDESKMPGNLTNVMICLGKGLDKDGIKKNEESLYYKCNPDLIVKRLDYDRIGLYNKENIVQDLNDFLKFSQMENKGNFIYPFLSKRKPNSYYFQGKNQDTYSVEDNFSNLPSKIHKIANQSHPQHLLFTEYCRDILGFHVGFIPSENNNEGQIGIFVTGTETIPIEMMGEGVANILGLIVILLTENDKLFLIEELENDIHPEALKKLLNLIIEKSKNNQFVISTHSNIVLKYLGSLYESKIFNILWTPYDSENENKNIPTSKIIEVEDSPEERLKIIENLGYDFSDYDLYKGFILFEESSAEQIIRDFIIPAFIPELQYKIKTIAAKGAQDLYPKYNDLHRTFVYFNNESIYKEKCWAIADGDDTGKDVINRLKSDFKNYPSENFINFKQTNFEYYYPELFQEKVKALFDLKDKRKKYESKGELVKEVINWIKLNPKKAKEEFQKSAKEVMDILDNINKKISNIRN